MLIRKRITWFAFGMHALGVLAAVGGLWQGLPPVEPALRQEFIVTHVTFWGLGWLSWALATFSIVLFYTSWMVVLPIQRRSWGLVAVGLAFAGGVIDWVAEAVTIFWVPQWAQLGFDSTFHYQLFDLWSQLFPFLTSGLANLLYTVGGVILALVAARTYFFPMWIVIWSFVLWGFSLLLSMAAFTGNPALTTLAAGCTFALLLPWLLFVGYGWLVVSRPWALKTRTGLSERLTFQGVLRAMLPRHPVPMQTIFQECYLVNFAIDPEVLQRALPPAIEPDLHQGRAYLSIVIAVMHKIRPAFLPERLGITYHQVVYRAVVRYQGKRGVYFLRSDADNFFMSLAGDWLTFFRFHYSQITYRKERDRKEHQCATFRLQPGDKAPAGIDALYDLGQKSKEMPPASHFSSLAEAQDFLVELFTAYGYDPLSGKVDFVNIKRGEWHIDVVPDVRAEYTFMQDSPLFPPGSAQLDSVFYATHMPYYWYRLNTHRERSEGPGIGEY
ncbi:MAG: DUF2071 domain-containing protein [Chloroflexi bacterium]|nr:DUF2071 domain-containing protein [Chloroflexota bacterium]